MNKEELWERYLKCQNEVFYWEDWNNMNEQERQENTGKVMRKVIRAFTDEELKELTHILYGHGHKREYYILKEIGY